MSMRTMGKNMPDTEKAVSHMNKYRRIKLEIEGPPQANGAIRGQECS